MATMTEMTMAEKAAKGLQLLQAKMKTGGTKEVLELLKKQFGVDDLNGLVSSSASDADRVKFYAACLRLPVFQAKPPDSAEARFDELCAALATQKGGDAHRRITAHVRTVFPGVPALPNLNNNTSIADSDKLAAYAECLQAIKSGDFSGLKGQMGKGDRRIDPVVEAAEAKAAAQVAAPPPPVEAAPPPRAAKPAPPAAYPPPEPDGELDEEAALRNALAAVQARKRAGAGIDESAVRRLIGEEVTKLIPTTEQFKALIGHAMNNGQFPESRVQAMIDAAKASAPPLDVDSVVKPRVDALLNGSLQSFLKNGGSATITPSTALAEGPLKSSVPKRDPIFVIKKEHKKLLRFIYDQSKVEPQNVFAVGPAGCGKSSLGYIMAAEFGMPTLVMNCAIVREPHHWFGQKTVRDGTVHFNRAQFARCVQEGGHMIIVDELPRTTDMIRNGLFQLLDHQRQTFVEELGEFITVGPGTIFWSTGNIGMAFTGCSELDLALADRLSTRIEVDYLPVEQEAKVLVARTEAIFGKGDGVSPGDAQSLAELAADIRAKSIGHQATLNRTVSTRQLIECAVKFKGLGVDGLTYTLLNHYSAEGGAVSEREQVLRMVQLKFPSTS